MSMLTDFVYILIPMLLVGLIFWLISLIKKDVSIVDSLWSLFFIVAVITVINQLANVSDRSFLISSLVFIWGIRLSLYITIRHWGHEEDHRYQAIRANNQPWFGLKSLYLIFGFQAVVAWIISLPLYYGLESSEPLNALDAIALGLWVVGMIFESVSDYQLYKFKQQPENKGKILIQGLWKYTRHPNYFGECLIWWGYFLFALAGYFSGELWSSSVLISLASPVLMTFLLLKFSGVNLLEKTMKSRPGYEEYMINTNAFVPGLPRKGGQT